MKNIAAVIAGFAVCGLALESYDSSSAAPAALSSSVAPAALSSSASLEYPDVSACGASMAPPASAGVPGDYRSHSFAPYSAGRSGYWPGGPTAALPLVTGARSAPDVYVTEVATSFTTYCPESTVLTFAANTYTVSASSTLTVTDCPGGCYVTKPLREITAATVTALVSSYTTFQPTPAVVTLQDSTYTVTAPTTLTVSNCPGGCTVTTPAAALSYAAYSANTAAATMSSPLNTATSRLNGPANTYHATPSPVPSASRSQVPAAAPATGGSQVLKPTVVLASLVAAIALVVGL